MNLRIISLFKLMSSRARNPFLGSFPLAYSPSALQEADLQLFQFSGSLLCPNKGLNTNGKGARAPKMDLATKKTLRIDINIMEIEIY